MKYIAQENSMWPSSKGDFTSIDEAVEWAEANLSGQWAIWKDVWIPEDPVYKNY